MNPLSTSWQAEPVKYFIEEKHVFDNGRWVTHQKEYVPIENQSIKIPNISLIEGTKKVVIKTYSLEHLTKNVEIEYRNDIITDVFIGIRNKKDISYIGNNWTSKNFEHTSFNNYFFRKNKPSGYKDPSTQAPGWPTNRDVIIDDDLMEHFETIKKLRPDAAKNLEKCLSYLSVPGPDYVGGSIGIKFKLPQRKN